MNDQTVFLLSWDMEGLEAVIDVGALEKENTWNLLQDKPKNNLNQIVNGVMLRARYNSQRHYEVYTVTVSEGITEQDLRDMFENNPQQAADLIRERGNKVYSDRIEPSKVRIS
jgi:hypothetical protein